MIEELEPPSAIEDAEEAVEVLRAWVADEHLQATLDPLAFEAPTVWGALLADLARHVANTWAESDGGHPAEIYGEIVQAFIDESQETAAIDTPRSEDAQHEEE
ncbi:MAG: DUF5076 domain-containing protein [Acidobacteriota bacterium]